MIGVRNISMIFVLAMAWIVIPSQAGDGGIELEEIHDVGIRNLVQPEERIFTGGQPSKDQFKLLADAGVNHIVNLRPDEEMSWDERAFVENLEMSYHSIPIAGAQGVTFENAERLQLVLENIGAQSVMVHCASGNRIGALVALHAGKNKGDIDAAIEEGKTWGLTRLEPHVRSLLREKSQ